MFEWSEELLMVRDAVRHVRRHRDPPAPRGARARRHAALRPPAQALQDLRHGSDGRRPLRQAHRGRGGASGPSSGRRATPSEAGSDRGGGGGGGFTMLPIIELCKCSPGMVTAMGVSVGLTRPRSCRRARSRRRSAGRRDLLTLDKIGAWAITEPELRLRRVRRDGVDRAPRRRRVRAQRLEDVHHQRPVRRHDRVHLQARRRQRAGASARSCSSCSTAGMPGLEQSKPLRKMGLHSSPTGHVVPRRRARRAATACSARAKRRSAAARAARRRRRRS